jgi:hypothetical protein
MPCATADGEPISYDLIGLGAPNVVATARVSAANNAIFYDITAEIVRRQRGEDRPFTWNESFFNLFVGSYEDNPMHRNWAGSDLSGESRILPGGIGSVNVPCTDSLDCVSKKHDIQYWLAANFQPNCRVTITMSGEKPTFIVENVDAVNIEAIGEIIGLMSSEQRRLLNTISR